MTFIFSQVRLAVATVLAGGLLLGSVVLPARAEQTLKNLKSPITIALKTPIDGKTAERGDAFSGVLTENYRYKKGSLPAGTLFEGTVDRATHSYHLANPGFVALQVEKVTLPSGYTVAFDENAPVEKVFHSRANTRKRVVMNAWPFVVVNAATTLPINLLTEAPGLPIGVASKMALGVAREFWLANKPGNTHDTLGKKVGYGILVGTGLPGAMFLASKRPEPQLASGDNVDVFLDPDGLQTLFEASTEGSPSLMPR